MPVEQRVTNPFVIPGQLHLPAWVCQRYCFCFWNKPVCQVPIWPNLCGHGGCVECGIGRSFGQRHHAADSRTEDASTGEQPCHPFRQRAQFACIGPVSPAEYQRQHLHAPGVPWIVLRELRRIGAVCEARGCVGGAADGQRVASAAVRYSLCR